MEELLNNIHKILGQVGGEIAISIVRRRVEGGKTTLQKWMKLLRKAADMIEQKCK